MDKNKDKNKKGVVEYFDNEEEDEEDDDKSNDDENNNALKDFQSEQEDFKQDANENMNETGIEEFLIKDKFSQLHDIIHEYQNALERNKAEMQNNPKKE